MDILDGAIRHQQAVLKIKVLSILRRPIDGLLHESFVFRMNPLENKFHGRLRCSGVLENSEGFFGPDDFAGGSPPAKTTRAA